MSNVIGFPHGFRGDGAGPVDPPCECSDGVGSIYPEGYRLNHIQLPEPTSSNPFPWFRVHTTAEDCSVRVQLSVTEFVDIKINETQALDMIAELATHVRRQRRPR